MEKAFAGACCTLASVIAHEAVHYVNQRIDTGEEPLFHLQENYIQDKCFGCQPK